MARCGTVFSRSKAVRKGLGSGLGSGLELGPGVGSGLGSGLGLGLGLGLGSCLCTPGLLELALQLLNFGLHLLALAFHL